MIAEPPSALSLFIRRLVEARETRRRREAHAARAPVDGGRLDAVLEPRALPPPSVRPHRGTALVPPPSPPTLPPVDILSLPDRDHHRTVVPDYDHIDYG